MRHLSLILLPVILLCSRATQAQLIWKDIAPPHPVYQFATSPDGGLYYSAILGGSLVLYYSSNSGIDWRQVYTANFNTVACDSSGSVYVADSLLHKSSDHGVTWSILPSPPLDRHSLLAFSDSALYMANMDGFYRYDNGAWDTIYKQINLNDWAWIYAGGGDQLIQASISDGSFKYWRHGSPVGDTQVVGHYCFADNSPIHHVIFAPDGYVYYAQLCWLARLRPGLKRWTIYVDSNGFHKPARPTPLAAIGASLITIDNTSTYLSSDHGDTWTKIGRGIGTDYPNGIQVVFTSSGRGYALNMNMLYTTDTLASVENRKGSPSPLSTPSPVHSDLHINLEAILGIRVRTLTGLDQSLPVSITADGAVLDVRSLVPGVYFAEVRSGQGVQVLKFVKE